MSYDVASWRRTTVYVSCVLMRTPPPRSPGPPPPRGPTPPRGPAPPKAGPPPRPTVKPPANPRPARKLPAGPIRAPRLLLQPPQEGATTAGGSTNAGGIYGRLLAPSAAVAPM